ncbi:MAG: B12-binding domain-containing radical SAM protein [Lachnospiraceae bacterium]|nr:B12-binding domain-containing radical SAM protein [Lachnospiraceae bacterium]
MKFLLVALNAKYIHSNPALYSLRAYAGEGLQEHIEIAEYTINHSFTEILADIYKRKPDVVGFSCYIWNISMILELVQELPKLLPGIPIWLGGPEVSFDAPKLLEKYPMLTGVMVGEGEETFRELLRWYTEQGTLNDYKEASQEGKNESCDTKKITDIRGLCLPTGYTAPRELTDMNTLPFLYEDLAQFQNRIIYYESSRGCPFRCSYCLSSIDKRVRLRDISVVKKELQFFLDNQVKQVKFVDRTFNCNHEHAIEIWKYILENDNGVTNFHFEISADILNDEELALLARMRPGLVQLEIGVQSANPQTLEAIHRTMNLDKLEQIVARINAGKNIHQHLDLIAGLPFEDYESFGKSFDRVYAMKPEQLQLGFLKVLKGSEMCERAQEYGIHYLDKPPYEVLFTNWLTFSDVLKLKRIEEMAELYYNSNQFEHTLAFLVQVYSSPFAMYEALADFYEKKGYFVNSPARSYRYQVLLHFACEQDGEYEAVYKELLTYDMYLRENLKSRPDFAYDLQVHKEFVRSFYKQEQEERRLLPDYVNYDSKQLARMTHLEPFYYPVWNMPKREVTEVSMKPIYVLFDYQQRNPLNGEAWTVQVTDEWSADIC